MRTISVAALLVVGAAGLAASAPVYGPLSPHDKASLPEVSTTTSLTPARHPERFSAIVESEGVLVWVDGPGKRLKLRDDTGRIVMAATGPETRIMDTDNQDIRLTELKEGQRVRVYYSRVDGLARQIDKVPSSAETILAPK